MLQPPASGSKPLSYSGERMINCFLRPSDGVSSAVVLGASGNVAIADTRSDITLPENTISDGTIAYDAVHDIKSAGLSLYALTMHALYKVNTAGTIETAIDFPSDSFGKALAVGDSYLISKFELNNIYWYKHTDGTFGTATTQGCEHVAYLGGFFVAAQGQVISVSSPNDPTTWNPLHIATADQTPGLITGLLAHDNMLFVMKTDAVEVWYRNRGSGFPFTRNAGAAISQGGRRMASGDGKLLWVTYEGRVLMYNRGQVQVVSTPEVTDVVREMLDEKYNFDVFTHYDRGAPFFTITGRGDVSLALNMETGLWNELKRGNSSGEYVGNLLPLGASFSATCATDFFGEQYFGNRSGKVLKLDPDSYEDDGEPMTMEVRTSPVVQGGNLFPVKSLYAQIESGTEDIGRAPQILMSLSKDGVNWGPETAREFGRKGDYFSSVSWRALGRHEVFRVRLRITDPVKRDIHGVAYE